MPESHPTSRASTMFVTVNAMEALMIIFSHRELYEVRNNRKYIQYTIKTENNLTLVLKWYFLNVRWNWGNDPPRWPPGVSWVLCHLGIKFQRLYTHVFEGKLFNGPNANLVRWFIYPEIQDGAPKPEVVLFWHVWLYLKDIWVDYYVFLVGKLLSLIHISEPTRPY